ncbi:g4121 [Coccomyxa elongata]
MGSTLADHHQALREQIVEQREALSELDELLQSSADDTGEIQQVRDQLYEAVQELEGTLAVADTATERSGRPEGRGDDSVHAGLGFRDADRAAMSGSEYEDDEVEDEDGLDDEAAAYLGAKMPSRASLAMMADAEAIAQAVQVGPQTDTIHFATWEAHTRGVGSKLMAAMGYRKGAGLGRDKEGNAAPIEVQMLRKGAGLGLEEGQPKRRIRGGERSRRRKLVDAAKAAREAGRDAQTQLEIDTGQPGLFAFINSRLTNAAEHSGEAVASSMGRSQNSEINGKKSKTEPKQVDRKALAAQQDEVAAVREKLTRLQQMAVRNANDRVISAQVKQKIEAVKRELAGAEEISQHAHKAVHAKEKERKWLKF